MMWDWSIPGMACGKSCGDGLVAAFADRRHHGHQSEIFISGFTGFRHRAPNMDTLVALGASAAFGWSVVALFLMTDAQVR